MFNGCPQPFSPTVGRRLWLLLADKRERRALLWLLLADKRERRALAVHGTA